MVLKVHSHDVTCVIRFFLYYFAGTKKIIYESVNLKGVVYN